jgi:hypothetical protein
MIGRAAFCPARTKTGCLVWPDLLPEWIRRIGASSTPSGLVQEGQVLSFEALEELLWRSVWSDGLGNQRHVEFAFQDAMGHRTKEVYAFCARHRGRMLPIQGKQTLSAPILFSPVEFFPGTDIRIPGGLKLARLDSNFFKSDLSRALGVAPDDPGGIHLHHDTTEDFARQMCVEWYDDTKNLWVQPEGKVQDYWDASYLARACWYHLGGARRERPAPGGAKTRRRKTEAGSSSILGARPGWFGR